MWCALRAASITELGESNDAAAVTDLTAKGAAAFVFQALAVVCGVGCDNEVNGDDDDDGNSPGSGAGLGAVMTTEARRPSAAALALICSRKRKRKRRKEARALYVVVVRRHLYVKVCSGR